MSKLIGILLCLSAGYMVACQAIEFLRPMVSMLGK